jgi:hypothetical protein
MRLQLDERYGVAEDLGRIRIGHADWRAPLTDLRTA